MSCLVFQFGMANTDFIKPDFLLFLRAAELRSFSKVADLLSMTQPQISKSIRRLEKQLGYPLFARKNTGVELTHDGVALAAQLRSLLEGSAEKNIPQFTIGGHSTVLQTYLPRILTPLLKKDFSIQWRIQCATSLAVTHMVNQLQLDFGIVVNPVQSANLVIRKLGTDFIGVWSKHKQNPRCLCYNPDMFRIQDLLRRTKAEYLIPINDYQVIYELARTGECSGLLPNTIIKNRDLALVGEPLEHVQISLIYHSENRRSPMFREILRRIPNGPL